MRFKKKIKEVPKRGDVKVVKEFAWFPMDIGDQWVWLEYIISTYEYTDVVIGSMAGRDVKRLRWKLVK